MSIVSSAGRCAVPSPCAQELTHQMVLPSSAPLRRCIAAVLLAALAIATAACSDSQESAQSGGSGRIKVVATTTQIAALAREVVGDTVDMRAIVPAGADAHEFEPAASDLAAIEGADLILRHGIGIDGWLDDVIERGSDAEVVTVTEGIVAQRPALESGRGADGASEEELDPHVWFDPELAKAMLDNVAEALAEADPARASGYEANAATYADKLEQTRRQVQAIIDEIPAERRKLVTNHDAFGYFARAFGLEIVGAVIPAGSTEGEPSAADTAALLNTIEREDVRAIFAESSVNPDLARTLARDAGVKIVDDLYADSLGPRGSGADTVDGMLLANARKIADALK